MKIFSIFNELHATEKGAKNTLPDGSCSFSSRCQQHFVPYAGIEIMHRVKRAGFCQKKLYDSEKVSYSGYKTDRPGARSTTTAGSP